jgi:hypothetical protein
MEATVASPRGVRLPGLMACSIASRLAKRGSSASTAAALSAGTLEAPATSRRPASRARASSAPMPVTKTRPSARST